MIPHFLPQAVLARSPVRRPSADILLQHPWICPPADVADSAPEATDGGAAASNVTEASPDLRFRLSSTGHASPSVAAQNGRRPALNSRGPKQVASTTSPRPSALQVAGEKRSHHSTTSSDFLTTVAGHSLHRGSLAGTGGVGYTGTLSQSAMEPLRRSPSRSSTSTLSQSAAKVPPHHNLSGGLTGWLAKVNAATRGRAHQRGGTVVRHSSQVAAQTAPSFGRSVSNRRGSQPSFNSPLSSPAGTGPAAVAARTGGSYASRESILGAGKAYANARMDFAGTRGNDNAPLRAPNVPPTLLSSAASPTSRLESEPESGRVAGDAGSSSGQSWSIRRGAGAARRTSSVPGNVVAPLPIADSGGGPLATDASPGPDRSPPPKDSAIGRGAGDQQTGKTAQGRRDPARKGTGRVLGRLGALVARIFSTEHR